MPDKIASYPKGRIPQPDLPTGDTYPYEEWWYKHLDGIGDDVELTFVDASGNDGYRLVINPEDRDAPVYAPFP